MLSAVLAEAVERKASDIHLAVGRPPSLRVHGELVELSGTVGPEEMEAALTALAPTEQALTRFRAERTLDFATSVPDVGRLRVNAFHQRSQPAMAIRRIPERVPTFAELQLPAAVKKFCDCRRGLVLVTGPTGSGKSSTLAAMVEEMTQTEPLHVITLEDPIEYLHDLSRGMVNQREIGSDCLTFAQGVRSALRQDPDVILVGELRDPDTISQALQAAETGHLVLATLHCTDAAAAVDRIINVFPTDQQPQVRVQLAATLRGVIAQRLFKRRKASGMVPAVELLTVTQAIRNHIYQGNTRQIASAIQTGGGEDKGMCLMETSVKKLYEDGLISLEDYQGWNR